MGIELPTPYSGGIGSPEGSGSHGGFGTQGGETAPHFNEKAPNWYNVEKNALNYEPSKEVMNGAVVADNSGQPISNAASNTTNTQQSQAVTAVLDDVPVVAADEDLIEKVWVDAVKGAITRTAGDPYARSAVIGKLQADYLQKRYGKVIGNE